MPRSPGERGQCDCSAKARPGLPRQDKGRQAGNEKKNVIEIEHETSVLMFDGFLRVARVNRCTASTPQQMKMKVTIYVDVISSWCFWAQPAWEELKKRYADR